MEDLKKTKKCEEDFLELVKMMSCHIFLSLLRAAISLPLDSPSLLRLTPPRSLKNLSRFLKLGFIQIHFVRRLKMAIFTQKDSFYLKISKYHKFSSILHFSWTFSCKFGTFEVIKSITRARADQIHRVCSIKNVLEHQSTSVFTYSPRLRPLSLNDLDRLLNIRIQVVIMVSEDSEN